jgi:uncharacterized protein (TIGR03067 family)
MKKLIAGLALLFVCSTTGEAQDANKIQGTWTPQFAESEGRKQTEAEVKFRFAGDKLIFLEKSGKAKEATFTLDASKKPAEIDMMVGANTVKGIYRLMGDTLWICMSRPGEGRPKTFQTVGTKAMLVVFRREKDSK